MSKLDDILEIDDLGSEKITYGHSRAMQKQQVKELMHELVDNAQDAGKGKRWATLRESIDEL